MTNTVFHSWQIDTPTKFGKNFLKEVLEEVCSSIASDTSVHEAIRDLDLDSDTKGVAGTPPIMETILKKIDSASVFVADMTFVGARADGRPTPNPNVLIEYGWALKVMSSLRTISVMNTAYGKPTRENLPFDLSHLRFPICYDLPEDATPEVKAKEKKKLISVFNEAIRASLATIPVIPEPEQTPFPAAEAKDGHARFRAHGEALGIDGDSFGHSANKEIFISYSKPSMYLRLMPLTDTGKRWTQHELKNIAIKNQINLLPFLTGEGGYSFLRAEDGIGVFQPSPVRETGSVAFAFETGEIWTIDTMLLTHDGSNNIYFVEEHYKTCLKNHIKFLKLLGVETPYRWIAGIAEVKGRHLQYPVQSGYGRVGDGPVCTSNIIETEGVFNEGQSEEETLLPFFTKIFDKCGIPRPEYLSE